MYQTINKEIAVIGVYARSRFIPKKFKWDNKIFPIQEITLSNDTRDGIIKKRFYSVICGTEVYRLEFNRDSEKWLLTEIWVE